MGMSQALQWWEEWKLRVLVYASLGIQIFLCFAAVLRKRRVPQCVRFVTWLAFLGSDAIAIYALATLFNINRQQEWVSVHRNRANWQALWAPILLLHIGGLDTITAYNIEDNELWRRHLVTAVSQISVAIYVFCKSWSGDKLLLAAGIFFFIAGIFKCLEKPLALKSASINSISNAPSSSTRSLSRNSQGNDKQEWSLVKYLKEACELIPQGDGPTPNPDDHWRPPLFKKLKGEPYSLFVDGVHSYPNRLKNLEYMVAAHNRSKEEEEEEEVCYALRSIPSKTFDRFYTKHEMVDLLGRRGSSGGSGNKRLWNPNCCIFLRVVFCFLLPYGVSLGALGTFTKRSRQKAFEDIDVRITFVLMLETAVLQVLASFLTMAYPARHANRALQAKLRRKTLPRVLFQFINWTLASSLADHVAQYNLIGYLARNRKHRWLRRLLLVGKDNVDELWCMKPCKSSSSIKKINNLVQQHIINGWEDIGHAAAGEIVDAFHRFNDSRGQRTLNRLGCGCLEWSLQCSFDESVLLWHLATDLCFYNNKATAIHNDQSSSSSDGGDDSRTSRQISNYMAYLLFVKPDMLMAGARRSLFKDAYDELKKLISNNPSSLVPSTSDGTTTDSTSSHQANTSSSLGTTTNKEEEPTLAQKIIHLGEGTTPTGSQHLVHDARVLYKGLMAIGMVDGEKKMWSVIQGVWVEMICFSAGRCRGYLHAKSLGNGGEYLSCVWLLMSYMGMETLAEKLQRTELPTGEATPTLMTASGSVNV